MNRKTAKRLGILLQIILLTSIGILIYLEIINALWMELGLVALMFGISMALLFVSEEEDEQNMKEKVKLKSQSK
jgi:cadmium resistance protein CadD (predicted permease)